MKRQTRRYTPEFKNEAVKLALASKTVVEAAETLGIPKATLHSWVNKAQQLGQDCLIAGATSPENINWHDLMQENKALKKRLARAEQEKAILKKAATYFAKELE